MAHHVFKSSFSSHRKRKERLKQVHVLVADHDVRIARLVRTVLENFGFMYIYLAKTSDQALNFLDTEPVDLLITEWPMSVENNVSLVEHIRKDMYSLHRDIPIIALTGKSDIVDVENARDAGITEYLVKPFTAKTLSKRIMQVVENPRSFIIAPNFVGPDRRRHRKDADDTENEKRMSLEELQQYAVMHDGMTTYHTPDYTFSVLVPNEALREKIGTDIDLDELFSEETVAEAQKTILTMHDEYLDWVSIDLNRLEYSYTALQQDLSDLQHLQALEEIAFTIKSQAGIFSYDLASKVGKLLFDYLKTVQIPTQDTLMIVRKHTDVLYVIFHQEITGSGAKMGHEILDVLQTLIEKYT